MQPTERVWIQNIKHTKRNIVKSCTLLLELQKKMHFDSLIQKSTNKVKTTWNIVK